MQRQSIDIVHIETSRYSHIADYFDSLWSLREMERMRQIQCQVIIFLDETLFLPSPFCSDIARVLLVSEFPIKARV